MMFTAQLSNVRHCQWLDGEPRERRFCGKPTKFGSSYCAEHDARCHPIPALPPTGSGASASREI